MQDLPGDVADVVEWLKAHPEDVAKVKAVLVGFEARIPPADRLYLTEILGVGTGVLAAFLFLTGHVQAAQDALVIGWPIGGVSYLARK